jgi:predicted phage-related endonuclease
VLGASGRHQRRSFIGGSDANVILSGHVEKILRLWREKRGEAEPEDLSSALPVMLGCWTEAFNRQWFEQLSGERVTRAGEALTCARHAWRRCTLDGVVETSGAVWEAKHTSAFAKPEEVLERYMPQLQHNMAVAGSERAVLSVIFGNHKYEMIEVAADWLYQLELLEAEEEFWDCVQTGREPVPVLPPPPPRPTGTREVCLEGNNGWASAAFDWLQHRDAAKVHASAVTSIKSLVEADVARAFGHGIEARRSKSGAISIRELAL